MISPRSIPQIPPAPSHAKKDPTKSPTQEEMIRKEFEALGIDYTSEDVLKVNEKAGSASNLDPIQTFSPTPKATATPQVHGGNIQTQLVNTTGARLQSTTGTPQPPTWACMLG